MNIKDYAIEISKLGLAQSVDFGQAKDMLLANIGAVAGGREPLYAGAEVDYAALAPHHEALTRTAQRLIDVHHANYDRLTACVRAGDWDGYQAIIDAAYEE